MVFGLFSKDRALKKAMERATSKNAQSPDRWAAMEKLRDDGGEEALFHLCKRFSFRSDKLIEDQNEKDWAVQALTSKGEAAIGPLQRYMKSAQSLGYPLKVLGAIATADQALEVIDSILEGEEPGYTRDPKKRIDVIEWLSELDEASNQAIVERVKPYLADFDENVRFKSVEAIAVKPHESAAKELVDALLEEEEESKRLMVRIAEVLADNEMDLCGRKNEVSALLDDVLKDFKLHRDKLVRKK